MVVQALDDSTDSQSKFCYKGIIESRVVGMAIVREDSWRNSSYFYFEELISE